MACSVRILVAVGLLLCSALKGCNGHADTQGKEFVFAIPRPWESCDHGDAFVVLTSANEDAIVNITIPALTFSQQHTVTSDSNVKVNLPASACLPSGSGIKGENVIVRSTNPISVHVFNHVQHADGCLVLPTAELGNTYYISAYQPSGSRYRTQFAISSLENPTEIEITPKHDAPYKVNIQPYKTYLVEVPDDPTGTRVQADQPIFVISASQCVQIGATQGCVSVLEQLPAINQLGQHFVMGPFMGRRFGYLARIVGVSDSMTTVQFSNNETAELNAGDMYQVDITNDYVLEVSADKPILVMQYSKSFYGTDSRGAESMVFVPALEQFSDNITFPVIFNNNNNQYYVHVVIGCVYTSGLLYDGTLVTALKDSDVLPSDSGDMCVVRRRVVPGVHSLKHREATFYVIVYGYRYSHAYAYPAGFNLHEGLTSQQSLPPQPTVCTVCAAINLICNATTMTAIFDSSVLPYTQPADVHLFDSECVASAYDATYVIISTAYDKCQTQMEENDDHIRFKNSLILGDKTADSSIMTTNVNIECRVERHHRADTSFLTSFNTRISYGKFSYNFKIFHDATYSKAFQPDDYPVAVKIGDEVYFEGRVETVGALDLFLETCWATPTADPFDSIRLPLIEEGCNQESSLTQYEPDDNNVAQFSFRAFGFKDNSFLVFVHCDMLVCTVSAESRCQQGCVEPTRRRRRSTGELHTVTSGPLIIRG